MRGFSPIQFATKVFFGNGSQTFGSPFPPPPSTGLWTKQTSPSSFGWNVNATDGAGTVLAVDSNQAVWLSANGGVSWTARTAIVDAGGVQDLMAYGNGVYIVGGSTNNVHRTADAGATWSTIATGAVVSGGSPAATFMIATDGASRWIAGLTGSSGGATKNYAVSTDNGLTWTPGTTFDNDGWLSIHSAIWNGTEFVVVGQQIGTGVNTIDTSPDGFTWTEHAASGPIFSNPIVFGAGVYVAPANDNGVFVSATPAGLVTVAETPIPSLNSGGVADLMFDGTFFFAFDFIGGVAKSADGLTWSTDDPLNFTSGDFPRGACVYDPTNKLNIAMGADGSISNRVP